MNKNTLREYPDICNALKFSIRFIYKEHKMTTEMLADKAGVSRPMLSYFLNGKKLISYDTLERIAKVFGMDSVEDLAVYPYLSMCRKELHDSRKEKRKRGRTKKQ